jgi:tetratricopeptide (TPR) repeat protein
MKYLIITLLFTSFGLAQDNSEKIVEVSLDACDCIAEIDTALSFEDKSVEIKECIKSANSAYQLKNSILNVSEQIAEDKKETETTKDSLEVKKNYTITLNSSEDYQEIEDYLMETCGDMRDIYFSNDKTRRKSLSKNEDARAYYSLGIAAGENGDYEKALQNYKKAVEIDPKFAFAWDNLGITYRRLNRNEEAVEAYKNSLKVDPKGSMPLMNIGIAYQYLEDYDNAIKYYEKLKKYYKDNPESYYGLSRMYLFKEDYKKAADNIMKAYTLYVKMESPYKADAEQILGLVYRTMEEKGMKDDFLKIAKDNKLNIIN